MTVFCPLSTTPVFYQGRPQVGAKITFYDAGTLTPRTVYGDGLLANPLAQPILSDGNACVPEIWLQGNAYRMRVLAPTGVQIRDIDNLPGDPVLVAPPPPPAVGKSLVTGDLTWNYGTAIVSGRVRANGRTIGNTLSGGTELADPSANSLFVWLWDGDPTLAVLGGRGTSAAADWSANKALSLPDFNGRTPFAIDGMGTLPSGRLDGVTWASGTAHQIGSFCGEAMHILTTPELSAHTHTATTASAGTHQHTGTTDNNTPVANNVVTDTQGSHNHSLNTTGFTVQPYARGGTDAQGTHSHGGATSGRSAAHYHVYNAPAEYVGYAGIGGTQGYSFGGPGGVATGTESADHLHYISADGNHAHNITIPVDNHVHQIYTDGAHGHNVTVTVWAHPHTFTSNPAGSHVHTLTSDLTGGGAAHNNMPPALLVTFYLVL